MPSYQCLYCTVTFSTPYALKRHISEKHNYIEEDNGETSQSKITYEKEPGLWDDDIPIDEPGLWDDDIPIDEADGWDDDIPIEKPGLRDDDLPTEDPILVRLR